VGGWGVPACPLPQPDRVARRARGAIGLGVPSPRPPPIFCWEWWCCSCLCASSSTPAPAPAGNYSGRAQRCWGHWANYPFP
jgi:hypothetical protein